MTEKKNNFFKSSLLLLGALYFTGCSETIKNADEVKPTPPANVENKTAKDDKFVDPSILIKKAVPAQKAAPVAQKQKTSEPNYKKMKAEQLVVEAERIYSSYIASNVLEEKKALGAKALKLFEKAANKGNGYACRRLGLEHSDFCFDDLTPLNYAEAFKWFQKGVELYDSESALHLSQFYFEGWGCKKDADKARILLLQSAKQGSLNAAHRALKLEKKKELMMTKEDKKELIKLDKIRNDTITLK